MNGQPALSWEQDRPATSPWQRHLTLPGLLALGWLVFEATSQPALGVVIVCVKFGWNDLLTAYWLRMRDPDPGRGRTCFWLYLNSGFLKIGAWAFGFCLLLAIMHDPNNPAVKGKNEAVAVINHTGFAALAALALGSLFALPTLWWAWQTGSKLWLDPAMHRERRRDQWPPSLDDSNGKNRAKFMLPVAFIFLIVTATIWALETWVRNPGNTAMGIAAALTLLPGMILVFREPLFGWALAKNPGECWARQERLKTYPATTGYGLRTTDYGLRATNHDLRLSRAPGRHGAGRHSGADPPDHAAEAEDSAVPPLSLPGAAEQEEPAQAPAAASFSSPSAHAAPGGDLSAPARPKLFHSGLTLSGDRPAAAILVFDTSYSMGYKSGDGAMRLDEAKNRGQELLNELPEGSRVAILDTAEAVAFLRGEWQTTIHKARERIKELKLKPANASVSQRLQDAYRMFVTLAQSKDDNPPVHDLPRFLCVFSDRTRASWDPARLTQLQEAGDQIPPTLPGLIQMRDGIPALIDSLKELRKTLPPPAGQDYPEQALIDALTPLRDAIAGLSSEDLARDKELPKLLDAVRRPARQILASLRADKRDKTSQQADEFRKKLLGQLQSALSGMQGVYSLFIDVGVERPADLAISDLEMRDEYGQPQQAFAGNRKVILRVDVKATGKDYNSTLQCRIGTKSFEQGVVIKAGETQPVFFRIDPTELGLSPGAQQVEVRLSTADLLPFNNGRFATFLLREPRRVLVLTDNTKQAKEFKKALEVNGFAPEVKGPGDFADLELQRYQAIFLFNVSVPKDELWKELDKEYVQKGGGLGIIPGGKELNREAYNSASAQKLMPGKLGKIIELKKIVGPKKTKKIDKDEDHEPGETWNLGQESIYQHPILRPFKDWAQFDLVRAPRKAFKYWEVDPEKKVGAVLVNYTGDKRHPALLERVQGEGKGRKGKVALFTTTFDGRDGWNDYMASNNSFYVVITGLVSKYLAGDLESVQLNFLSGQADPLVKLPVEPRYPAYSLRGPDVLDPIAVEEGQNDLVLKQAVACGNYTVEGVKGDGTPGKRVAGFSVNIPSEESDLTRVPPPEIEALFGAGTVVPVERKTSIRESLQGHWNQPLELFPFLMILLLLVLAVENLLANKFYKREPENP